MFYQSISDVYDYIFPQNENQLFFLEKVLSINKEDKILDIGCATGNLTDLLNRVANASGLDLDQDLLEIAKSKYNYPFTHGNMLLLKKYYPPASFNHIVSFGNTLVHLENRNQVQDFFDVVYEILKPGGSFTVQIINYDRILNQKIDHLPTIENNHIRFVRNYKLNEQTVDFETELLIKSSNQIINNNIPLLSLRKDELEKMLYNYKDIHFYGNLKGDFLQETDIPLIFTCIK